MKKILTLVLAVVLMAGAISGCGEKAASDDDKSNLVTLQFWAFQVDKEKSFMEKCVEDFNASHDDIQVEITFLNQSDYTTTLIPTAFANGEAPDVIFVEAAVMDKYASQGMLGDLTSYYSEELKADIMPSALEAVTYDGKILALPFDMELVGLFYDKDVLDEAEIEVPKTWDELYEAAKKLTTDDRYGLVLPVEAAPYTLYNWWPFEWMNGGQVLSEDKTQAVFDSRENAEALDYWAKFFNDGFSPKTLKIGPWDIGNIGTGAAAMQVAGTYVVNAAEETYGDKNIQVAPLPTPEGKETATCAGGQKLAVTSSSEHQEEAAEFIMWMFGSDDTSRLTEWCTQTKFAYPTRQSVVDENEEVFSKGLREVFTNDIYPVAIPEPSYPAEVTQAVTDALQAVCFGNEAGSEAVKTANEKIAEVLTNN